jgi:arginine decarboxylase
MDRLYEKLINYEKEDCYPFHMPGHKRNVQMLPMGNPYAIDITEIEGFDNLHQAEGILKKLSERIGRLYGSGKSFPLVNGSTVGILAGISAVTNRGDKVLLARNSHKSVYHASIVRELNPVYIYPQRIKDLSINGGISTDILEQLLITHKDIRLVAITSPTYEGIVSDIKQIAEIVHRHGAILLVDEAHGAHFGFHKDFPSSAVTLGADIVIQSLHKTLPAFTQSAVLHCNRPEFIPRIEKYLAIYESSSPSYLLMAGMDRCISIMEEQAKDLFEAYVHRLNQFTVSMEKLRHLTLLTKEIAIKHQAYDFDISKITAFVTGTDWNGHQLGECLREKYHIIMEMEARDYVLGMTSICDTQEGFQRLEEAFLQIDSGLTTINTCNPGDYNSNRTVSVMAPWLAMEQPVEVIPFGSSVGRISAAFISLFPPGAPFLIPGERIDENVISEIEFAKKVGITVTGLNGENKDKIEVIK